MRLLAPKPPLRVVASEELQELPPPQVPTRRRVQPLRGMDTYSTHAAYGLTADMLVAYYRQAERGAPLKQFDTFEDLIEVGGHLRGLLADRIEAVAGCDWVIQPGRADKPSELAARMLEERLRALPALRVLDESDDNGVLEVSPFREFLEHQLTAPHFGIANTNIVWDLVERIVTPIEFINVAHRRFAAPNAERAHQVMLISGLSSTELLPLEPGLWARSRARHRNPFAGGTMRSGAWWEMFKRWGVRDWQTVADMFGIPTVVGYYQEGASKETREALVKAVKQIGEDGYTVLSNMAEIVVKEATRGGDAQVFSRIIELCEQQQSKLIAGSSTAMDTGGQVGSYNLGVIHEARAFRLARRDTTRLEDMFARDIGIPFVEWNRLEGAAPPRLKMLLTRDSLERAQVLEKIGQMVDIDEEQVREEFALRKPAAGRGVRFPSKGAPTPAPPSAPTPGEGE